MDEIFIAIMEQIAQEMPELSLIDEDYGQLEMGAEEDQYPVTFPCVLIGNTNSDWHDLGYGAQKSESALTVRLAIDCYDDTSYASGTYDKVRERQQLAEEIIQVAAVSAMHGQRFAAGTREKPFVCHAALHQGL